MPMLKNYLNKGKEPRTCALPLAFSPFVLFCDWINQLFQRVPSIFVQVGQCGYKTVLKCIFTGLLNFSEHFRDLFVFWFLNKHFTSSISEPFFVYIKLSANIRYGSFRWCLRAYLNLRNIVSWQADLLLKNHLVSYSNTFAKIWFSHSFTSLLSLIIYTQKVPKSTKMCWHKVSKGL